MSFLQVKSSMTMDEKLRQARRALFVSIEERLPTLAEKQRQRLIIYTAS
jgi:hypothetical protein